jgi:preprotein translocase subunit SecA
VITPAQEYQRTACRVPARPYKGVDALLNRCLGVYHRRRSVLEELRTQAEQIEALAGQWKDLPNHLLHERLMEFRAVFRRGGKATAEALLPALAAIREAADRQLGLRPFGVQLMGALALHRGCLAEMATGEGKTLTAGLAAVLAGWTRRPCHIVTVNDYLVERDAHWLRPLYTVCGVRVGCVTGQMPPPERQKGYACDITYATSKELLADFLRDRLRIGPLRHPTRRLIRHLLSAQLAGTDGVVMRGLHTAIVDEADSVLIDEAVTPLIIASPHENELLKQACQIATELVAGLEPQVHYQPNLRYREIELTEAGRRTIAATCASLPGLWRGEERRLELVRQALSAREFFHRDKQYIIQDGKVVIVDEFTGRPMPQRTWREGMHQAIEAKENLPISDPSETIARLSFQRFFRCFYRLAGMTGTAREAAGEFWQIYTLPVVAIPTNRPCIRQHWPDRVFADEPSKWQAVVMEIERLHQTGRPILAGTRNVAASEKLAGLLVERGLNCNVLNAVRLPEEAAIVALAGQPGHITIATNMAGRGTDIKLGEGVAARGGLHVIATERHESGRVDRQLFGRAARQGDPGSAQAFVSAEDELLRRYLPKPAQHALRRALTYRLPGQTRIAHSAFALAQQQAQALAFKQRQAVLRTDTWLEEALSFAPTEG